MKSHKNAMKAARTERERRRRKFLANTISRQLQREKQHREEWIAKMLTRDALVRPSR